MRGNVINRFKNGKRQWWSYNPVDNVLVLSPYDMTDVNLPKYIEKIVEFKPVAIQGYPSNLFILASFLKNNNFKLRNVISIFTSSEILYPYQREIIEEYFEANIYDHYGNTERNALIMQCEKGGYHIISEYGFIELIGENGKPVNGGNKLGEIIATGFNNFVCPLLRYRTMDLTVPANAPCECGRNYPLVKKVEGRLQEFIISGTGRLISMTAMNMHSDVFDHVKQFQFYQEKKGEVLFNVVRRENYTDKDTVYIQQELHKKLGEDVKLIIRFVEHIPRTRSGKYHFLVQKLPVDFGETR